MVTFFTEQDLVSFGNYLLSPIREKAYLDYGVEEEKIPALLKVVNNLDLQSWIAYLQEQKKATETQINESTSNQ